MDCKYQIGDIVKAKVSEVKPYAAFICFEDGQLGMIHISEISDSYIRDIDKFISKGDEVIVKVLSIDYKDNFIRASFKQVPLDQQYTTHINKRKALMTDINEFESLMTNLPTWIKNSLEKHNVK